MFLNGRIFVSALATFLVLPIVPPALLISSSTQAMAQLTSSQGRTIMIPAGTTFEGRIDTTLSSKKSRAGERFNVILSSPLLANGSDVLIPAGAMVIGEVVEAMASSHQPHEKKEHPSGKLRVQITALKMPDGTTYPLVGSFIGETTGKGSSKKINPNLGTGVAYIGSQSNFNAVYPSASRQQGGNHKGPQLITRKQMMDDPLLGDPDKKDQYGPPPTIRSLVKDHYDLFIHEGSPMSIRLDAPLKIALAPIGGMTPSAFSENDPGAAGRPTFSRPRSSIAPPPSPTADVQQQTQPQVTAPPLPTGPSFLEPAPGAQAPIPRQSQMQPQMQQSFGAQGGGGQSLPPSAPQSGGWFKPPTTPAEQAAAAQSTPYFNAAPQGAQALPATAPAQSFGQPQSPPQPPAGASFNALQPTGQTAAAQSAGGFSTMSQSAMTAPAAAPLVTPGAASSMTAAPANAAPPIAATSAQTMGAMPAQPALPSLAPPALPSAPPAGQSLDSFINSLGSSRAGAATGAAAGSSSSGTAATPPAVPAQTAP